MSEIQKKHVTIHQIGPKTMLIPSWHKGDPIFVIDFTGSDEVLTGLAFSDPEIAHSIAQKIEKLAGRMETERARKAGRSIQSESPPITRPEAPISP